MAQATTEEFAQMILETSENGTSWTKICGMVDVTFSGSSNMDTAEVPDCDDETLPLSLEKSVRSIEFEVSGTGVWAQESHQLLSDWLWLSQRKQVRIGHLNSAIGDTEYYQGFGYLSSLQNQRQKGSKVSAELSIMFDGTPTRVANVT